MVIEILYYILPGIFANMMPIFVRNIAKPLAYPVDHHVKFMGKPLFGSHKTYRGFIFGVGIAILVAYLQKSLYIAGYLREISYIDYSAYSAFVIGAALGFGALFGDLVESFIKRRVRVKPGKPFIPWDQVDFLIGIILFSAIIKPMTWPMIVLLLVVGPFVTILTTRIGYYLKIRKEKW